MDICSGTQSKGHEEIVHEDGDCPLCEQICEIATLEETIERLLKEGERMEERIAELEDRDDWDKLLDAMKRQPNGRNKPK